MADGRPHVLTVSGNPYERGVQHGSALAAEIQAALPSLPADDDARARHKALSDRMCDYLQEHFPEVIEEIEGIADGADIDFDAAFLRSTFNAVAPALDRMAGCTSVGFAQSDVGPILGKTDDGGLHGPDRCLEGELRSEAKRMNGLVVLTSRPEHGRAVLCVNPAGTLWGECGLNDAGLCMGHSSGRPAIGGQTGAGVPQHIMCRLLLTECASVAEAVSFLKKHPLAGKGLNTSFVDANGHAAAVDNCCAMHAVREPVNDVVFAVNHYADAKMFQAGLEAEPRYLASPKFQNSLNRYVRLSDTLHRAEPPLTFDLMKQTICDHTNPGALCQHHDNNTDFWNTNFGAIMVAKQRVMWLAHGHPCRNEFVRYAL